PRGAPRARAPPPAWARRAPPPGGRARSRPRPSGLLGLGEAQGPDLLLDALQAVPLEVRREPVEDAGVDAGIHEVGRPDLHRAAPRDEELQRVLGAGDAADADDRDAHRP